MEEPVDEQRPRVLVVFGEVQDAFLAFFEIGVDDLAEVRRGVGEDDLGQDVWVDV